MNISQLLTMIKMDLGIYGLSLPFEDPDKALMDVIQSRTIKTFSVYQPRIETIKLDLTRDVETIKSEYTESIYVLPNKYCDREIIDVRKIIPINKLLGNGFLAPVFDGNIETYMNIMQTQANANLASVAAPPITHKFVPPNKLHVYNMATAYGIVDIEIEYEHASNLSTIPTTAWESFYDLALIDVKRFLYATMKHYNEINTAFGTISMKIDDWSNAESERRDLIDKWRDTYHLDKDQFVII